MLKEEHCLRGAGLAGVTTLHRLSTAVQNRSSALIAEKQPGVTGRGDSWSHRLLSGVI